MNQDFEIKFGRSRSVNYKQAVSLAKKFSNFVEATDENPVNVIQAEVEELLKHYDLFGKLTFMISGWRSSSTTLNGREIQPYDVLKRYRDVIKCSDGYELSFAKESYCNLNGAYEGWGCKFLTNVKRHIGRDSYYYSNDDYWYKFGSFDNDGIWHVNKIALKERLGIEAEEKRLSYCTVFSLNKAHEIVDQLPDTIDPSDSKSWKIDYQEDFVGNTIEQRAVGISHVSTKRNAGFSYSLSAFEDDGIDEEPEKLNRFIPNVTFEDIGGIEKIVHQIREVIELPLKHPEVYRHLGIVPHKGVLLYGPPGNGKTLIAKAIANEVQAHFIPIAGPELITKWHGQSEENLRKVFLEARDLQPSIIFFDEIDSVAQTRSGDETNRIDARFVNQLLTLMDGMESYDNVTVLASTNRPELIDPALLRPGRFDFKFEISKPDASGCSKILKIATRNMPLDSTVVLEDLVSYIVGCSGAEIQFIVREAALNALRRMRDVEAFVVNADDTPVDLQNLTVGMQDFRASIEKLAKE